MSVEKVLVSVIAALFQSVAVTTICLKQQNINNKSEIIKFFIPMFLYCMASFYFIPNQLRFILFIFVIFLIQFIIITKKDKISILYAFNTEIIMSISEIIISFVLIIFNVPSSNIEKSNVFQLLINILVSLFSIFIIYIPIIRKLLLKVINIFKKNNNFIKYLYVFIIIIYIIILKNGLEFLLKSNYYINVLFIIGIVVILNIIIRNESKYEQLKEENKQMLNYVTKYEKIITAQGKTNHEFKNQLMVIRGYAQMNSNKIIEYIDEIVEDSNKAGSSYLISQLNNFPDGGIKGLLYYKLSIMEDENIKYSINVEKGVKTKLKTLSINNYKNITKILGVLLDNAIDASNKSKHKKINISVIKDNKNIVFKIYNTYKGKIDIEKIGTGYTSKGNGHGYGLRLVKDIINEDKLFNISHNLEDNYFVSSLYIKK